jgi:hypothetical protein
MYVGMKRKCQDVNVAMRLRMPGSFLKDKGMVHVGRYAAVGGVEIMNCAMSFGGDHKRIGLVELNVIHNRKVFEKNDLQMWCQMQGRPMLSRATSNPWLLSLKLPFLSRAVFPGASLDYLDDRCSNPTAKNSWLRPRSHNR